MANGDVSRAHSSLAKGESDLLYAAATGTGFEKEINIYFRPLKIKKHTTIKYKKITDKIVKKII